MMIRRSKPLQLFSFSVLAANLACGVALAQEVAPRTPAVIKDARPGVPPISAIPTVDHDSDARSVHSQLREMLQQYPPSLLKVLQLDPTLINNTSYLAPYPALAAFFSQHPEIAHNPAYFLGTAVDYRPSVASGIGRAIEPLAVASVFIVLIAIIGWIIRAIMNHRRWLRVSKLQTDMQNKLLERFSSNEEMLAFIQTPAGKKFLESASVPQETGPRTINAPIGRILWSAQLGIVTLVAGAGFEIVAKRLADTDAATGFEVAGVLVIALGIGFVLSAIASYILSRRLGLLEPAPPSPS
jgi:hypothetical protein